MATAYFLPKERAKQKNQCKFPMWVHTLPQTASMPVLFLKKCQSTHPDAWPNRVMWIRKNKKQKPKNPQSIDEEYFPPNYTTLQKHHSHRLVLICFLLIAFSRVHAVCYIFIVPEDRGICRVNLCTLEKAESQINQVSTMENVWHFMAPSHIACHPWPPHSWRCHWIPGGIKTHHWRKHLFIRDQAVSWGSTMFLDSEHVLC